MVIKMKPFVLCILDGVGIRKEKNGNAVKLANTPTLNYLLENYPNSKLEASGTFVGLPAGQMGNSEVGHLNIGAGRVVYQPLQFITKNIEDKTFFENKEFLEVINHSKKNNSKLHICGLLSDGGIHSHISHLFALLELCKKENVKNLFLEDVIEYFDKNDILFTGDFVFKETIGNFEEDNEQAMINSLKVFKYMSVNVKVYPGHDEETTVEHELKYNPFLRGI